jgi:hypothetical protein
MKGNDMKKNLRKKNKGRQRTSQANEGNSSMMEQVIAITKATEDGGPWEGGTLADLRKLVEIGASALDYSTNLRPTIGEFLEELAPCESKVRLEGYVHLHPVEDVCVEVDAFVADDLTADEALALYDRFRTVEDAELGKNPDGTYSVRFWCD